MTRGGRGLGWVRVSGSLLPCLRERLGGAARWNRLWSFNHDHGGDLI